MTCERETQSGFAGDGTAQKARKPGQSSKLYFVNVAVRPSRPHFPVREAEAERSIRAHVMRDYLQRKPRPSKCRNTSQAAPRLSDHLTRFRLPVAQENVAHHPRSTKVKTKETPKSSSNPRKQKAIIPKHHHNLQDDALARSLNSAISFNIPAPIDISTLGTSALLEYYHTSFWDNSLTCNPEGQWIAVAISDASMLHATLCLVALHKSQTRQEPLAKSYFWHRGEAMRLISSDLADPDQAVSDATVGAVAVLSASDNSVSPLCSPQSPTVRVRDLVEERLDLHALVISDRKANGLVD